MGFSRLAVGQTFFKIFELWIGAPIAEKELFALFEFLSEDGILQGVGGDVRDREC